MHPYSLDTNEHRKIPLYLSALAIISAWGLSLVIKFFDLSSLWWIEIPSVIGFYEIYYSLFNEYLWKWNSLRRLGMVKVPMLFGTWKGTLSSSFNSDNKKEVEITIKQTWTDIQVCLLSDESSSCSITASISLKTAGGPILTYQYQNDPRPNTADTMHIHYGTTRLCILNNLLEGEYYSGRDRKNIGLISVKKI